MNIVRNVLAFVVLACLSSSAQQITGNFRGTVTDPSGAVILGAEVTAQQAETALSRTRPPIATATTFFWNFRWDTTACMSQRKVLRNTCRMASPST